MLNSEIITITVQNIEYNIFVSPFSLHSKQQCDFKSGKLEKLFFYNGLKDDEYETGLQQTSIDKRFISDKYILNYGQDFEKYYLGSFNVDFDSKTVWQWEGHADTFREQDAKILAESLFNPNSRRQSITMFTPTKPSDINLKAGYMDL
ncbi:hypothetical protein NF867_15765 [Solitalea sp. MAHUQ-68]|uniref:Uncharacterized protein n=1 Tax=Solitalea agri TaxID=2953739 RepID=A0A9X2F526_9SPHI|nr:hypothetical protein [Solitalea agri]MCO4294319.1 hypothetical protein [Solitalea agri]